ncbi:fucose-specific lectin [Aspergillus pseudoustus]|uniref:Fucose-specific lectin n=1 Tax=Aspergillus pseudoustus TaxID=1810923 RepID=A0ABR4K6C4_9EURO
MATTATDIRHGTAIAAVNKDDKIRVFWQSQTGRIEESVYDGGWKSGGSYNSPSYTAKLGSPLAACTRDLNTISLFFVDASDHVRSTYYQSGTNLWGGGATNQVAAAYTKLGATYLPGTSEIHLFFQLPNNDIQEVIWSGSSWSTGGNLGPALPGSSIAVTASEGPGDGHGIRVYVQAPNLDIVQKCWSVGKGWWSLDYVIEAGVPSGSAITVTQFTSGADVHLRVYWTGHSTDFWQWCWDSTAVNHPKKAMHGKTIQGTDLAAICWPGTELRVYYQGGTKAFGITEWQWGKGNSSAVGGTAQDPLPPA